jgi:NADPH:quinone reductase-like Zn-dependent oxidoreductase
LGADRVIATQEEDFVAQMKEITGGKGAHVIFDPVAGPFLEKLAESVTTPTAANTASSGGKIARDADQKRNALQITTQARRANRLPFM